MSEIWENALERFTFAFPQAKTLISYYTIFNNKAERISWLIDWLKNCQQMFGCFISIILITYYSALSRQLLFFIHIKVV